MVRRNPLARPTVRGINGRAALLGVLAASDLCDKRRRAPRGARQKRGMTMTGREADPELRRSANSLLRKNGNDLDKALVAYCKYLLDDATTLRPLEAIKGGWDTAHDPGVYIGHADLLQHTTRGCIDFLGKADYVVDPCGIKHPIEKSGSHSVAYP